MTRFQLSKTEHPIRLHKERVIERVPLIQNGNSKVLQVITDTEPVAKQRKATAGPKSEGDALLPPTDDADKVEEEEAAGPDMVDVVIVNKAKVSYFFTDRVSDASRFFEQGDLELRITLGKNWNKYIAVYKTSLLRHFKSVEFNRSTETHYSKNVLLFSDNLEEGLNLRLTLGVALDKQTDVSDI